MCIWSGLEGLFDAFIYCISAIPWLHLFNVKLNILIICTFCYSLHFFGSNQEMTIHVLNTSSVISYSEQFYFFIFRKTILLTKMFFKRSLWFFSTLLRNDLKKKVKFFPSYSTINLWNTLVFWLISI